MNADQKRFALIGVGGFVAPRHLKAIKHTGHLLVAAVDPNDSVGVLDQFGYDVRFFTEIERFERHLDRSRRATPDQAVDYVSICSPNYLHDAHCRLALRCNADAICEKPLVINPWNLDLLEDLERETGRRIWNVMQLRLSPSVIALRDRYATSEPVDVTLTYITARGQWYHTSWKGSDEKAGGIATNIGVHLFDMMCWLFGPVTHVEIHLSTRERMSGHLECERARISWFLSISPDDLPPQAHPRQSWRSLAVGGEELEFTDAFADLHTATYRQVLAGSGFGIDDVRPAIELVHRIRETPASAPRNAPHPLSRRFL